MNKMKKLIIFSILAVMFNCNLAIAAIVQTGEFENGITWTLTDKNVLIISGNGSLESIRGTSFYDKDSIIIDDVDDEAKSKIQNIWLESSDTKSYPTAP